ncbi:hypothetical protein RM190_08990 [Paracoccus sp. CPCC 101403]|uniref:Baseplate assembly protein n=1 Tax=Paracoccus broussonetiae TaxID=3075834 RepID=A0ABU3ECN5_9RHOB|nr:hypothetical protein [Paracoccus sp. CPCC 101403]MDT1061989.1 hypothetical protein [Paracoccus sp. CPCC 101403]
MSRPPIHRPAPSPRGDDSYFGPDFAALVQLAEAVARDGHGIEIPAKGRGLARTLIELPALLAHVLGEHQGLYAREANLGSALLPENLSRHARRLAYTPDPGAAATGLAAFTVKPGLSGSLPKGFALQTSPLGEIKARTLETLAEAQLDAGWNAIRPAAAEILHPMQADRGYIEIRLNKRHGLARDDVVVLANVRRTGVFRVVDPLPDASPPRLALRHVGGSPYADTATAADWAGGFRLLCRPRHQSRVFGWNAPPGLWPAAALASPSTYAPPATTAAAGTVAHGYESPASAASRLLLAEPLAGSIASQLAAVVSPSGAAVYWVDRNDEDMVSFVRGEIVEQPQVSTATVDGRPVVTVTTVKKLVETRLSARVATLALNILPGAITPRNWTSYPLDATVLAGWADALELWPTIPNPAALQPEFAVMADLSAMRPGRPAILRRLSTGEAREAVIAALKPPPAGQQAWTLRLEMPGGFPSGWAVGDVELLGNVIRVSDGETVTEILGGSDGVTPHQGFALKKSPVTRLAGAEGSQIALETRVDGVLWDLAPDFHAQAAEARIHSVETDAKGAVTVRFGGEGRGAIPPSGRRNITATYRQGLGDAGNAGPGRLNRIRRASPLLDSVTNPLAIAGGTDAAGPEDIARQAVRPVRVFDRAVSVEDHADLALLFPGIVRASARWRDGTGIELVAADAAGAGPADPGAFLAFMDARRDTGMALQVLAPQAVDVSLGLRVERDRAWLAEAIRRAVEESLLGGPEDAGLFTFAGRDLSAPQSLSGIYARLLALPGVAAVHASRYGLTAGINSHAVADIVHASTRQWLRLAPSALEIQMVEPDLLDRVMPGGAP